MESSNMLLSILFASLNLTLLSNSHLMYTELGAYLLDKVQIYLIPEFSCILD